jgi:hypothetical protein
MTETSNTHKHLTRTQRMLPQAPLGQASQVARWARRDSPAFGWVWRRLLGDGERGEVGFAGGFHAAEPKGTTENVHEVVVADHPQALQVRACEGMLWVARLNGDDTFAGVPWQVKTDQGGGDGDGKGSVIDCMHLNGEAGWGHEGC